MAANFINLEEIIDDIELQNEIGSYTNGLKRYQIKRHAIRGVNELDSTMNFNLKSLYISVEDDGTVQLPDDYLDYAAIYVLGPQNTLVPLARNDKINVSVDPILDQDGNPILDEKGEPIYGTTPKTKGVGDFPLLYDSEFGQDIIYATRLYNSAVYGAGGGKNQYGYYKLDIMNNAIQLDLRDDVDFIVLDYISESVDAKYDILIPAIFRDMITAWVNWRAIQFKKNIPDASKERAKRDYFRERRLSRRKKNRFRLEEWMYQNSTNQKQYIKF